MLVECVSVRTTTDDAELDVGWEGGEGADKISDAFFGDESSHIAQCKWLAGNMGIGAWHKVHRINAGLGDDTERPGIAVIANDAGCLVRAGQGMAGMGEGVAFEPTKGWWVGALDIGVIIKTGTGAYLMSGMQGQEGGEIEGFFVDMHYIGAESAYQRPKGGVVV